MKTDALAAPRTKKSRISFRPLLYVLLCVGMATCGGDDSAGVDDDPCQATTPISLGESMSGQLHATDCLQPDGAFGDR
jgi:hypothetical protein